MRWTISLLVALGLIIAGFATFTRQASAIDLFSKCTDSACSIAKENKLQPGGGNIIWSIVKWVLGILGGIAVLMIVISGIRYATSRGDAAAVTAAKNTLLYSVVGLVVALLATAIVSFVSSSFK